MQRYNANRSTTTTTVSMVNRKTGIYFFAGNCRIIPENTKNLANMHVKSSRVWVEGVDKGCRTNLPI